MVTGSGKQLRSVPVKQLRAVKNELLASNIKKSVKKAYIPSGNNHVELTAKAPVIQAYFAVNSGAGGYDPAIGTVFESQQKVDGISRRTEKQITGANQTQTQEQTHGVGANFVPHGGPVVNAGVPNINVSEHSEIAIENTLAEPRNYFSTPAALALSNNTLNDVNSNVRLHHTGQTINVPTNPDPAHYDATPKTLTKTQVDPGIGGAGNLADFFGTNECNNFVKKIIGSTEHVAVIGTGIHEREVNAPSENEPFNPLADYVSTTPQGLQTPGDLDTAMTTDAPGVNEQDNYNVMNKAHVDPSLGINSNATANIGEGYVVKPLKQDIDQERMNQENPANQFGQLAMLNDEYLQALTDLRNTNQLLDVKVQAISLKAKSLKHLWVYHYAGVVAKDGGDNITLENYNRGQEKRWNINDAFDDLYIAHQAFRDFVAQQTPTLKAQDHILQRNLINQAQQRGILVNGALQAFLDLAQAKVNANIGPINDMIHFKMYGSMPGQSFHEKWQPSTANQVTLRVRQSVEKTRATKVNQAITACLRMFQALTKNCPNPYVSGRLINTRTYMHTDMGQVQVDLANAVTINDIMAACRNINLIKNNVVGEIQFCLQHLLPNVVPQALLPALIIQINGEIANNAVGMRIRRRAAAQALVNSLQALHDAAVEMGNVQNF
jgi:hypothetical protein